MTGFPNSPRLASAGIVLVDPGSGAVTQVIALQYVPDTLTRALESQAMAEEPRRSQALRLKGPAAETITLEAVLDATDRLEFPDQNAATVETGIFPDLAALEMLVQPASAQLSRQHEQAAAGILEIAPIETPLALFVWSAQRIVPVRVSSLSITEEAFDPRLNPIRAKVSMTLKVLTVDDLGFGHRGGGIFMAYLQAREALMARAARPGIDVLGIGGLP